MPYGQVGRYAHSEPGDSYRISHRGNVVVEHNWSGTEETVRNGRVVGSEPLQYRKDEYQVPARSYYAPRYDNNNTNYNNYNHYNRPTYNDYNRPTYIPTPIYNDGRHLITSRQALINLVNDEVGYNVEHIYPGDTARISERGNLVIEHNSQGTEDVIAHGEVISRNEPLHHTGGYGYSGSYGSSPYIGRGGISFELNIN
jgi:hypothetical protein